MAWIVPIDFSNLQLRVLIVVIKELLLHWPYLARAMLEVDPVSLCGS